ncbi:MAG: type IV toxin-antitoxin system AbiEi family antitoxin domain-containing protein [Streptosporangiaceae bacterium]
MSPQLPLALRDLAELQSGVISRRQALSSGLSKDLIATRLNQGRWQRVHPGVYAAHSGGLDRQATLWAAVLRAGLGAALSHHTAAELDRLADRQSTLIHVTIPTSRRVMPIRGVALHTRVDAEAATHPSRLPPRLRLEETIFDLADTCDDAADAISWVASALGRRLTTQDRLRETMRRRARVRWRDDLALVLDSDLAGIHSLLEFRYVRDVERRHALPKGQRQAVAVVGSRRAYRDVLYEEFGLIIELDGRVAHPGDRRWLDISRDNAAAATGFITLRYGHRHLTRSPCLVAAQVADVLRLRGWRGVARRCCPGCPIP